MKKILAYVIFFVFIFLNLQVAWCNQCSDDAIVYSYCVLPNLDDDDLDGIKDFFDNKINGIEDLKDFTKISVNTQCVEQISFRLENDNGFCKIYQKIDDQKYEQILGPKNKHKVVYPDKNHNHIELFVEAGSFATSEWDGAISLRAQLTKHDYFPNNIHENYKYFSIIKNTIFEISDCSTCKNATQIVENRIYQIQVTPWLMFPNSAKTKKVYIATGQYPNQQTISQLRKILKPASVPLMVYTTYKWWEIWMQDGIEIGYTKRAHDDHYIYVALQGLKFSNNFSKKFLAKNKTNIQVAKHRNNPWPDGWIDWYGNLEVTPPLKNYPHGRVYYGVNTSTGRAMHPDIIKFIKAQKAQYPFSVDVGWLSIKHVDEIFNFVKANDGTHKLIIVSTRQTEKIYSPSYNITYNRNIQKKLDTIKKTIKDNTGYTDEDIIELPVWYQCGRTVWSNPVNSIYINRSVICGNTYLPAVVREDIANKFTNIGIKTYFINDKIYHENGGNLHCATNTLKIPPKIYQNEYK